MAIFPPVSPLFALSSAIYVHTHFTYHNSYCLSPPPFFQQMCPFLVNAKEMAAFKGSLLQWERAALTVKTF